MNDQGSRRALLTASPLCFVILAFARVTMTWVVPSILFVSLLSVTVVKKRLSIRLPGQALVAIAGLTGGYLLGTIAAVPEASEATLSPNWYRVVLAAMLVALPRLAMVEPYGGTRLTYAAALLGLIGCGGARSGALYPIVVIAFLGSAYASLRGRSGSPRWMTLDARRRAASLVALAIAAGSATAAALSVPTAHDWAVRRLMHALEDDTMTGFGEDLELGSLEGMMQSDEIVLRAYGAHTDYLRGVVYDYYAGGRWLASDVAKLESIATPNAPPLGPGITQIHRVLGRSGPQRYFLPLGARGVGTADGESLADPLGVLRPTSGEGTDVIAFLAPLPSLEAASVKPQPPRAADHKIPSGIARDLRALAMDWTRGSTTTQGQAEAIERRLRAEYTYSLHHEHAFGVDPTLEFLRAARTGHCEYFASAMALLLRSIDVPARVAGGYRVNEHSDVGGYDIVRERDAHAWVEAWIPDGHGGGAWQTFDPTPPDATETAPRKTSLLGALLDATYDLRGRAGAWLRHLRSDQIILGSSGLLLSVLIPIQWLRKRGQKGNLQAEKKLYERNTANAIDRLLSHLASIGTVRSRGETLERFAGRVQSISGLPGAAQASELVLRYAALLYGGEGDGAVLSREVEDWVRSVSTRRVDPRVMSRGAGKRS